MADLIDRQVAIDMILEQTVCTTKKELVDRCDTHIEDENGWLGGVCVALDTIEDLPSAQPEPISEAYAKAVRTWLVQYQIKCAELQGRYTPYEVLGWIVNDWRKDNGINQ